MIFDPQIHHRRSIRLSEYNYSQEGAYFITIVTHKRECIFGVIDDHTMHPNTADKIATECWLEIPIHFPYVLADSFIVMPNHIHGILALTSSLSKISQNAEASSHGGTVPAQQTKSHSTIETFGKPISGSIPTIIRSFKSAVTRKINIFKRTPGPVIWQSNYFERVIRNYEEWEKIREYVNMNPISWADDKENPLFCRK